MRVISLVPSLTETLLDCGVEVVGRTRFCIHPADTVSDIPVVGGTKEVNWDTCRGLAPDLVVMDREENTREMADACPFAWHATHVTSVDSVGDELAALAGRIDNHRLRELADGWRALAALPPATFSGWQALPGFRQPIGQQAIEADRIEYMIWRDPWMAISDQTFIGSMLGRVGLGNLLVHRRDPYPDLSGDDLPHDDTFYLFSSEPFPFERYVAELQTLGFNGALVDGEFYSWFGSRSYRLLKDFLV